MLFFNFLFSLKTFTLFFFSKNMCLKNLLKSYSFFSYKNNNRNFKIILLDVSICH